MIRSLFDCICPPHRTPTAEVYPLPELPSVSESPKIYPVSKYAYSFQRRLRELATPKEAYNIQLADIDQTIDLNPTITHSNNYTYRMVYNQQLNDLYILDTANNKTKKVNNSTLYNVESIYLYNVDASVFDHALFRQILNDPHYLLYIVNSNHAK
uniref:DPPIV_N domain-containing protein n=1 Tax=Panagrellus redivivus TaxID=6233 RepID=A0A7E4WCR2_PANRE